jgi:hypothetical protein
LEKKTPSLVAPSELLKSDVLIAADVIYDISVVESLVSIIRHFLAGGDNNNKASSVDDDRTDKQAIFALTKRNIKSFETFLDNLHQYGISCQWLARGSDWDNLPRIFRCNFVQPRFDVYIAALQMTRMATITKM